MDAKDIIQITRDAITEAEGQGVTNISPESLKQLLANLEQAIEPVEASTPREAETRLELYKAELGLWLSQHQHVQSWQLENFRSVIILGQSAMKSVILINGGAAVALLAFLGHAISAKLPVTLVAPIAQSLFLFVVGVILASVSLGTTYASQMFYALTGKAAHYLGVVFHLATVLLTICAYIWFFRGAYHAISGFQTYAT